MRHALAIALLVGATVAVYYPAWNYGFVNYDDPMYVTENPVVLAGMTPKSLIDAFADDSISLWTPLTLISYQIEVELFGVDPAAMHRTNIMLHALNSVLLYLLFFRLSSQAGPSFLVAAIFAVHPTHVESVAWVSERKDVLSTVFWMLTCHAWVSFLRSRSRGMYTLSVLLLIAGLLAKPMLMVLPAALVILDFWPLKRIHNWDDLARVIREKVPLFGISGAFLMITIITQARGGAVATDLAVLDRIGLVAAAYVGYLNITFYPLNLAAFYPRPETGYPPLLVTLYVAILVVLTLTFWIVRRRAPYLIAGWGWFVVTLIPVVGAVPVGAAAMADRYTYIPSIGLGIVIAWSGREVLKSIAGSPRRQAAVAAGAVLVVITALAALARSQVRVWEDSETLFHHALRVGGQSFVAHTQLASLYLEQNRVDEGMHHARAALDIYPEFPTANNLMATAHIRRGEFAAAIPHLELALEGRTGRPAMLQRLAAAHHALGNLDSAEQNYRLSIATEATDSRSSDAMAGLLQVLVEQHRVKEAERLAKDFLQTVPDAAYLQFVAGNVAKANGDIQTAEARYRMAVRLDAGLGFAWVNLGNLYAAQGQTQTAIDSYKSALETNPSYALAHRNLAEAYFQMGRADLAQQHQAIAESLTDGREKP